MKESLYKLIKAWKSYMILGLRLFIRVNFFPRATVSRVPIAGHNIWVRSRTPDLQVALSSLNGEYAILQYALPRSFSGCIVDAGAYIGTAAIALKQLFPRATIVCIEPSKENLRILKANCDGLNNIKILERALVARNVKDVKLIDRGTGEWGYTVVEKPLDNPNATKKYNIKLINIAEIRQKFGEIAMLKLDIEGSEREIFLNDGEELRKIPIIFAELHDRIADGCTNALFALPGERVVVKAEGEKYLSLSLGHPG